MAHTDIFEQFKRIFPIREEFIDCWFPNGKNSIRIRMMSSYKPVENVYEDFVFTFLSPDIWKLESVEYWFKELSNFGERLNDE